MAWPYILLGYALGSVPFGLLLTRAAGLGDIRRVGSGNIGATNVLRTGNRGLAAATLLLDAAKGLASVLIGAALGGFQAGLWAGLGAVLGHLFPVWLALRGGKGVATGLGVLLAACWPVGIIACATWILVAATSRISSASALAAFALAPIVALVLGNRPVALLALAVALLVFARHAENIRRLLAGTEPRIGSKA
ncbi:MAG: glycerol-3-phosphate 1-O-acyltransferase PlsY [Acetobacteraceae bacterium]|nr:glycerol-3-phosphate 1-O-acyltransferase PlsY [Acetobacteraceae bacterium]MBV8526030.1 glycerol-3-phosphate 1-O-acyltransferase PlsY [Acetobacteraceae bacterium]